MRIAVPLLALTLSACSAGADAPPPPDPVVRVFEAAPARPGDTDLTGDIRARVESDLGFRVGGEILERYVDRGQRVRRGQPLMRIDAADLALAANAAAARTAAAERSVAAARAEQLRAESDLSRYATLLEGGHIAPRAMDQYRAAAQVARANVAAAEAQARATRSDARQAGNARTYALLTAEADGVVVDVLAEPGQVVAAGQPVLRLAQGGAREAVVDVPETVVARLPRTATARLYAGGPPIRAELRELAAAADPVTRTYRARYTLSGSPPLGATVTLAFADSAAARLRVPLAAIHQPGQVAGVWVVGRDRRVRFRPVALAALEDEHAVVTRGLRPGERVVALGAHLLQQGQRVRPQSAPAA